MQASYILSRLWIFVTDHCGYLQLVHYKYQTCTQTQYKTTFIKPLVFLLFQLPLTVLSTVVLMWVEVGVSSLMVVLIFIIVWPFNAVIITTVCREEVVSFK